MHRSDNNQTEIVEGLRRLNYSVASERAEWSTGFTCSQFYGNHLDGSRRIHLAEGMAKTTPKEQEFHSHWRGKLGIVTNLAEALALFREIA